MASHQHVQEPGNRLRLVAAASVVALAVVLPLAAVAANQHDDREHGRAGHSASSGDDRRPGAADRD